MHVAHSLLTLFKRKKRVGKVCVWGGSLHKFYIHKAADKLFFSSSRKHFPC